MATTPRRPAAPRLPTSLERLERMSPEERLRTYRCGTMTRAERSAWAGAFPEEAPLVNDELEWIALSAE
jgi:hypothetical protein